MPLSLAQVFFDAHNHLQDDWLRPHRAEWIGAMDSVGVAGAVVNGTTEEDWMEVAALARLHPWMLPSFGLHPWFLKERTPDWQHRLEAVVRENPQCAIGEIGLDRWIPDFDLRDQLQVFSGKSRSTVFWWKPMRPRCRCRRSIAGLLSRILPKAKR